MAAKTPLYDTLLTHGATMHLADLKSSLHAHEQTESRYADQAAWAGKAIPNVAGSGKFPSDRTIAEYAEDICHLEPCPVHRSGLRDQRAAMKGQHLITPGAERISHWGDS